ncbi:MAG: hydroxyacid dehydrogenase [Thaumarchaeota archaeon]|nr:hydroxyacid dehydrogenase [Nitrososphaerota archaeon]
MSRLEPIKVLVCDPVELDHLKLGARFALDYRPRISREELLAAVGGYDVLIVRGRTQVDRTVLERGTRLKVIARPGTGLDNLDLEAATQRGVAVLNSPEALIEAVAEHVVLLMLALSRRLTLADGELRAGRWLKDGLVGVELKGKSLGILGLGRIGRRVAEVAGVLGMSIKGYDAIEIPGEVTRKLGIRMVSMDELFSSSIFITLHVPLTKETRHLVDAEKLRKMMPGSYLINTSRGGVIDEKALIASLKEGRLGGAALDVFETEPASGEILSLPNIIVTPHIGGQTVEAQAGAMDVISGKIEALFSEEVGRK